MYTNKIKLKVKKKREMQKMWKKIKNFYYLSDFSYGEKLILIKDGKDYAYVNLLEDKTFEELEEIINLVLKKYNIA